MWLNRVLFLKNYPGTTACCKYCSLVFLWTGGNWTMFMEHGCVNIHVISETES